MKIYICRFFDGHYPVGASAVIIAESPEDAKDQLESELKRVGLEQEVPLSGIKSVETDTPNAIILTDGNY